jgi:hypothetical protein
LKPHKHFVQWIYSETVDVNEEGWSYGTTINPPTQDWEQQAYTYLLMAFHAARSPLEVKYRKSIIDKLLRGGSDLLSSRNLNCVANTSSAIQWYCWWSERALEEYDLQVTLKTAERGGKAPTHRQVCDSRQRDRRCFTVEHQFPIAIPKQGLIDGWSFQTLADWMWKYGTGTIITHEENRSLQSWTLDMTEAHRRYDNILRRVHPLHADRV